jgi:uncharacterized protein DUF6496
MLKWARYSRSGCSIELPVNSSRSTPGSKPEIITADPPSRGLWLNGDMSFAEILQKNAQLGDNRAGFCSVYCIAIVSQPANWSHSRFVSYMAKYGKKAAAKVERAMHERKHGTLKSGSSGKKVTSRKQAIAIGLAEARRAGAKVPRRTTA